MKKIKEPISYMDTNNSRSRFYDDTEGLYGYKDEHGKIVIPAVYERAEDFYEGLARVENGIKTGAIDETGKIIIPFEYDSVWQTKYWIHTRNGNVQSLFSKTGELLLSLTDIISWNFPEEEIIRIKRESGWGCVSMNGALIIPCTFQSLGPCLYGRLPYYENGFWGYLDKTGKVLVPATFDHVGYWNREIWWGLSEGTYKLYNFANEMLHNKGWLRIVEPGSEGAAIKTTNGWEFIDHEFKVTQRFPVIYDWVEFYREGLAAVKREGKWGFIDADLKEVIPAIYKRIHHFAEGLASVELDGYYGFINKKGATVIPFIYRNAGSFQNGKAMVEDSYVRYQIDISGQQVSESENIWD